MSDAENCLFGAGWLVSGADTAHFKIPEPCKASGGHLSCFSLIPWVDKMTK